MPSTAVRRFASRAALLFGLLLPTLAPAQASPPPAEATADAPSDDGLLAATGRVLMPDGSPAVGATVISQPERDRSPRTARTAADGSFRLADVFGNGVHFHAHSADGSQQALLWITAGDVRRRLAAPVEIKLAPAVVLEVVVRSDGKPVEGAHVAAWGLGFEVAAVTDPDGKVRLQTPAGQKIRDLVAWHPTLGIDGKETRDDGIDHPDVDLTQLSLRKPAPRTVRVVDTEGKPVAGLELAIHFRPADASWMSTRTIEAARVRTGEDGTATVAWAPENAKYVDVDVFNPRWKLDDIEPKEASEGESIAHVSRKQLIVGRLNMPPGESAEGILVTGDGFGPANRGDGPDTRARRDGTFSMMLASGHSYVLTITDSQWATTPWRGRIGSGDEKPAPISIDVYPATPVTIRVVRGANRQPVTDAWVELGRRTEISLEPREGGKRSRTGIAENRSWLRTDSAGRASTGTGLGEMKLRLSSGDWDESRTIHVDSAAPIEVEFYRPWQKRHVSARLTLDGKPYPATKALRAIAWAERPTFRPLEPQPAVAADGTVSVDFDADNLCLLVVDPDQSRSGFTKLGAGKSNVEIEMQPTASFAGRLVDADSKPLAGQTLRLEALARLRERNVAAPQKTDQDGRFAFTAVPSDLPLRVSLSSDPDGPRYFLDAGALLLLPGESRTGAVFHATAVKRDGKRAAALAKRPDPSLIASTANICELAQLGRMRGLVILRGDDSDSVATLADSVIDHDVLKAVLHYLTLDIAAARFAGEAKALADYGWPLPKAGEIVLVVLDAEQKTIASQRIGSGDTAMALRSATDFLEQHQTPRLDAPALIAEARKAAQASGRRVWLVEGGPRCGPCFRLARWMHEQQALLEKDYVVVKVMDALDTNLGPALDGFELKGAGVPWYAITEPDGTVLTTSVGPLGNIGLPGSVEGLRHFREMLDRTRRNLTSSDVDALVDSLAPKN